MNDKLWISFLLIFSFGLFASRFGYSRFGNSGGCRCALRSFTGFLSESKTIFTVTLVQLRSNRSLWSGMWRVKFILRKLRLRVSRLIGVYLITEWSLSITFIGFAVYFHFFVFEILCLNLFTLINALLRLLKSIIMLLIDNIWNLDLLIFGAPSLTFLLILKLQTGNDGRGRLAKMVLSSSFAAGGGLWGGESRS